MSQAAKRPRPLLLTAALWYARKLNWYVFPVHSIYNGKCTCKDPNCNKPAKHPLIKNNLKLATTDLSQITIWWTKWFWANIGIACGKKSGIWVLDVDINKGGEDSFQIISDQFGDFETPKSVTGSGGFHHIFKHPGEGKRVSNKQGIKGAIRIEGKSEVRNLPGIDVRGDGGYIIVSPSIHESGNKYSWAPDYHPSKIEIAQSPEALLKLVSCDSDGQENAEELPPIPDDDPSVQPSHSTMARISELVKRLKGAVRGELHSARYESGLTAGRLCGAKLIGSKDAIETLIDAARSNPNTKAPLKQIHRDITDGFRAGLSHPWKDIPPGAENPPLPDDKDIPPNIGKAKKKGDDNRMNGQGPGGDAKKKNLTGSNEPTIVIGNDQLSITILETWGHILKWNKNPPKWFERNGEIVRIKTGKFGPIITPVTKDQAYGKIAKLCRWIRLKGKDLEEVNVYPPKEVAADLLAYPHKKLPPLYEIGTVPIFDHNAQLLSLPGYHKSAALWLNLSDDLSVGDIPEKPVPGKVVRAIRLIREDLIPDFGFASESDQAHAISMLLLPFVRRLIDGPTPIHLIEAPTPGSGKSLLIRSVSIAILGQEIEVTTIPGDETEMRKQITTMLLDSRPIILLDNLGRKLFSPSLAAAITSVVWHSRDLGHLRSATAFNRAMWVVTANNPALDWEVARRCCRIRIEPGCERPEQRTQYKHELPLWAQKNRSEIVSACLTIVRHWIAEGRRPGEKVLGSFESWSKTMGGILEVAGIKGFLGNSDELYQLADNTIPAWAEFVDAWWMLYQSKAVETKVLVDICIRDELLPEVIGDKGLQSQRIRLGRALARMRGRVFNGKSIEQARSKRHNANIYQLVEVDDE
jgi:hypothetical protein